MEIMMMMTNRFVSMEVIAIRIIRKFLSSSVVRRDCQSWCLPILLSIPFHYDLYCNYITFSIQGPPCDCSEGYEGPHCEFQSGTVPECILECGNGGQCVIGIQSPEEVVGDLWTLEEINQHMWCDCPNDYDGRLCQVPKEQCRNGNGNDDDDDDSIVCFHGGTCVSTMVEDGFGNQDTDYHCDCTTASTDNTDLVAGRYCQYEASSVCDQEDGNLL
jgi:hypothetical protein